MNFIARVIATTTATSPLPDVGASATPDARTAAPSVHTSSPRQEPIVRPAGLPRANIPANVPSPEHHHLPGWVRRTHGQARPILADLLGLLDGDARATLQRSVDDLTDRVSSGKFSLAWRYPALIAQGMALYEQHRTDAAQATVARRTVDMARSRVSDQLRQLRDGAVGADVQSRLGKALRSATDMEAIRAVEAEIAQVTGIARTGHEKRRDREIERTRARIRAGAPRAAEGPTESWQDVLRRFADTQAEPGGADHR